MACTLLLPITNRHVTALPCGLTMARILLHDDPDPDPDAGIVLLSYRPGTVTALRTDKPRTVLPCEPDKSSCRYAYEPTLSLASYCYPEPTSLVPLRLRYDPDNLLALLCLRDKHNNLSRR
jgi:hypothetical protein